jgi:hypothetical protein
MYVLLRHISKSYKEDCSRQSLVDIRRKTEKTFLQAKSKKYINFIVDKAHSVRYDTHDVSAVGSTLVFRYCPQITSWSLRGVNVPSAVRGVYRACRWTEGFLLVSDS